MISTRSISFVTRNGKPCEASHSWHATPPINTNASRFSSKCARNLSKPLIISVILVSVFRVLSGLVRHRNDGVLDTGNRDQRRRLSRRYKDRISNLPFVPQHPRDPRIRQFRLFPKHWSHHKVLNRRKCERLRLSVLLGSARISAPYSSTSCEKPWTRSTFTLSNLRLAPSTVHKQSWPDNTLSRT